MEFDETAGPDSERELARRFAANASDLLAPLRVERVRAARGRSGRDFDLLLRVALPNGRKRAIGMQARRGLPPGRVPEIVRRLRGGLDGRRRADYLMLLAPYVSERTGRALREEGVGYVDLNGNLLFEVGTVIVERRVPENRFAERDVAKTLFARKSARVMCLLLEAPQRIRTVVELAREARVSVALVQKLRDALVERGFAGFQAASGASTRTLPPRARPFRLSQPGELLDFWARRHDPHPRRFVGYYTLEKDRAKVIRGLAGKGSGGALTGFAAAALLAPYVRSDRIEAYVSDPAAVAARMSLRPAESGGTVFLAPVRDPFIVETASSARGIRVVSPVLVYLDLSVYRGRAGEQAAYLRRRLLGY